jgi:precorrin-6B methylase 1
MDTSELRRRLRASIDDARRDSAERRTRADIAARDYENFLTARAIPMFHDFANVLNGEGHAFKVFTPAGSVRLASARSGEEFIEVELDTSQDPPVVIGRTSRGRGRRMVTSERPIRPHAAVADLTEEDVAAFVLEEIGHFIER